MIDYVAPHSRTQSGYKRKPQKRLYWWHDSGGTQPCLSDPRCSEERQCLSAQYQWWLGVYQGHHHTLLGPDNFEVTIGFLPFSCFRLPPPLCPASVLTVQVTSICCPCTQLHSGDKRLDLCKQVIGPGGVDDLLQSICTNQTVACLTMSRHSCQRSWFGEVWVVQYLWLRLDWCSIYCWGIIFVAWSQWSANDWQLVRAQLWPESNDILDLDHSIRRITSRQFHTWTSLSEHS